MRLRRAKEIAFIIAGTAIAGAGINAFNIANDLAEGGVTGLAILLKFLLDWDPGLMSFAMNLPLLAVGFWVLGTRTLIYTIIGTTALSGFLSLFGWLRYPVDDPLIAALLAGVSVGLGLGIVFRYGGTTGGSDIIARILKKRLGIRIGRTMFAADILVIGAAFVYLDVKQAVYTLVAVFVGAKVIDLVQEAGYSMRKVMIISESYERIAQHILEAMNRGVTLVPARGAYTGQPKTVIYTLVSRSESVRMKRFILDLDPGAFVSISDAGEVLGEGFTLDVDKMPLPGRADD